MKESTRILWNPKNIIITSILNIQNQNQTSNTETQT